MANHKGTLAKLSKIPKAIALTASFAFNPALITIAPALTTGGIATSIGREPEVR